MANKKVGGFVSRLWLGKEKSEDYARGTLPSNRWELFWDIIKGSFGKLVIVNILTALFCIPLGVLLYFRSNALASMAASYPFSQPFGLGFMSIDSMVGYAESINLSVNAVTFLFLPIAAAFMAVGISGAAYVIRNMVWTEGIFVANDYWKGVKENFGRVLAITLMYSLIFYILILGISYFDYEMVKGEFFPKWACIVFEVITYLFLAIFSVMTMHMFTLTVTYELKFTQLIRNAFILTIGLPVHNILFALFCVIPFIFFFFGGLWDLAGIVVIFFFGISFVFLVWTDYAQWSFDRFINDKVEGAQKNRGIYEKVKKNDANSVKKYKEQLALAKHSSLNNRPIKPITDEELKVAELPAIFSRKDLEKLRDSKQAIYDDHAKYVEEHKNDEEFKLSNEEQAIVNKELDERTKRIEKAKKELAKRNKKK